MPTAARATKPFPPTVLRESVDGTWKLDGEHLGGARIFIIDAKGGTLLLLWIKDAIPKADYDKFVHRTTAGPLWEEYALRYFFTKDEKDYFCVRTWWGRRILLNLREARQASDEGMLEALRSAEERTVKERLRAAVAANKGKDFQYLYEGQQTLAAIHWAGRMKMEDTVPLLQLLEESDHVGSCMFVPGFDRAAGEIKPSDHCVLDIRRNAQLAIRRLGTKPAGYPATTISTPPEYSESEREIASRNRHQVRTANADQIKMNMKPLDVLDKLGSPDYVERWQAVDFAWRYDMDAEPSFSLVVVFNDRKVESVQRWEPALWHGDDLIPASCEKQVFEPDGSVINAEALRAYYGKPDPRERPEAADARPRAASRVPPLAFKGLYWAGGILSAALGAVLAMRFVRRRRRVRAPGQS
jgi:hypothetical protein